MNGFKSRAGYSGPRTVFNLKNICCANDPSLIMLPKLIWTGKKRFWPESNLLTCMVQYANLVVESQVYHCQKPHPNLFGTGFKLNSKNLFLGTKKS